jgi:hypothetical protein
LYDYHDIFYSFVYHHFPDQFNHVHFANRFIFNEYNIDICCCLRDG